MCHFTQIIVLHLLSVYYWSFENNDSDSIRVSEIPIVTDSDSICHPWWKVFFLQEFVVLGYPKAVHQISMSYYAWIWSKSLCAARWVRCGGRVV